MTPITCMLVDDEPLARSHLRCLLEQEPGVRRVGEAGRKTEALSLIASLRPQLLFLDIRMPGGGGFEIIDELAIPPAVIFVTAHDQHAIRAFEVNATDYLLKPVDPLRLRASIDRIRRISAASASNGSGAKLVPLGNSGILVDHREIHAIEADGHYSRVTLSEGRQHLIRQSFNVWEEQLPGEMFVRLDRGLIVNRSRISSCTYGARAAELRFDGMTHPLVLGTAAAKRLRKLFSAS